MNAKEPWEEAETAALDAAFEAGPQLPAPRQGRARSSGISCVVRRRRTKMKRFAKRVAVVVLFTTSIGCGGKPGEPKKEAPADTLPVEKVEGVVVARTEVTFQIRHSWSRNEAVLVRLNTDRLRAYNLSKEDVMRAVKPSGLVDRKEPPPPPGVVFINAVLRPDQYGNIIVKANAEGEIVRLKDVAKLDLFAGREAREAEPGAAADGGGR